MFVTILWIALLALCALIELIGRARHERVATLSRTASLFATRIPGRVLLVLLWIFVGLHLFARYTVPSH
jgi:sorbitol-specific phosphotransferase system component IIC